MNKYFEIRRLAEARQNKGWTQKEIDEFAMRRAQELKRIASVLGEPDYLASGELVTEGEIKKSK